jgi:GNAT superfamily N-acetyltransferase
MVGKEGRTTDSETTDFPVIRGITLRRYGGERDLPAITEVINLSRRADGVDFVVTREDNAALFGDHVDFDPEEDVLVAEADGKMIGLARVRREDREGGRRMYGHSVELLPEWRGEGIREELFHYNERHIRRVDRKAGGERASFFLLWANDTDNDWKSIVEKNGYQPAQHELDMVRSLDEIPDMPLPVGFEIRSVKPEHYGKIWEADRESSLLDWDFSENKWDDEHFRAFMKTSVFQPDLWQVAWSGETLAGMVLNYIVDEENRLLGKKQGHTEHVFVREQFRHKGLARALLARSFQVLKDRGMNEATLGMEVENPHDPLRLYEGMGFRVVRHYTWYQKPIS